MALTPTQTEKLQHLLMEELNHRVKNTLATVQAIANQSLRHAKDARDFVSGFGARMQALARAHDVLTRSRLQGADVMQLVHEQVCLAIGEIVSGVPANFLAHARIRFVEINFLFGVVFGGEACREAIRFERSDHLPRFLFRRNQQRHEFVILRRSQSKMTGGAR